MLNLMFKRHTIHRNANLTRQHQRREIVTRYRTCLGKCDIRLDAVHSVIEIFVGCFLLSPVIVAVVLIITK